MFVSTIEFALVIASLGAGLMAGVYFAFSAFVMRSLDRLGAAAAADAMNSINEDILRSWFMPLFFGTTLLHAALAGIAVFVADLPGRWWLVAAGLVYVAGMFVCTVLFNVPLNDRLAAAGDAGAGTWNRYYRNWTRWNHLRTAASLAAAALGLGYLLQHA